MNDEVKNQENEENKAPESTSAEVKTNPVDESGESELDKAQKRIAELEELTKALNDKVLRSLAEMDNVRRRSKEELEKSSKYAITNFASDLVLVAENFYLAAENMPNEEIEKNPAIKNFADAILMTKKELTKVFEKNGIKRIYPLGEKFDHNFHEAIAKIPSDGDEENVVQVIQAGYLINDRLIRPALVGVSIKNN